MHGQLDNYTIVKTHHHWPKITRPDRVRFRPKYSCSTDWSPSVLGLTSLLGFYKSSVLFELNLPRRPEPLHLVPPLSSWVSSPTAVPASGRTTFSQVGPKVVTKSE
ncbi:hypothetical protein EJB05_43221, partial [Eragrostis curvula]